MSNVRRLMRSPKLIVRRYPFEEPYHAHLEFEVDNGLFVGQTDFYCNTRQIADIGNGLIKFPQSIGDEYIFQNGSEDPKDNCYRFFLMRAYTIDLLGHCALQFAMNANLQEPADGTCKFSIPADPAALNRLGESFREFAKLEHLELVWSPTECDLHAEHRHTDA